MNTLIKPSQATLYNLPQLPMREIAGYLTPWGRVAWRVCSKQMKKILNPKAEVFLFNSLKLGIRSYIGDFSVERVQAFAAWLGSEKDQLRITNFSEFRFDGPSDFFREVIATFRLIKNIRLSDDRYLNLTYPTLTKFSFEMGDLSITLQPENSLYYQVSNLLLKLGDLPNYEGCVSVLPSRFPNLTKLHLRNGRCTSLPQIPTCLREFVIFSETLAQVSTLPDGLQKVNFRIPALMEALPLPTTLQSLTLTQTNTMQLGKLHTLTRLEKLSLSYSQLNAPLMIPVSVTKLTLMEVKDLIHLDSFPPGLAKLQLFRLPLSALPEFPNTLRLFEAKLEHCEFPGNMQNVTTFCWTGPAPSAKIDFSPFLVDLQLNFSNRNTCNVDLPYGLRSFVWMENVTCQRFPPTLINLEIVNAEVTAIPRLPTSLLQLRLLRLNALKALPVLPDSLELVEISCKNIEVLPNIPLNITRFYGPGEYTVNDVICSKRRSRAISNGNAPLTSYMPEYFYKARFSPLE